MKVLHLLPNCNWNLYFPEKSICETIKRYHKIIDINDFSSVKQIINVMEKLENVDDVVLKEFFSEIFYRFFLYINDISENVIFIDDRFEPIYKSMISIFEHTNEIRFLKLIKKYENNNNLNFFSSKQIKPVLATNRVKVLDDDKYVKAIYGIYEPNGNSYSYPLKVDKLTSIFDKFEKIYDQNDAFSELNLFIDNKRLLTFTRKEFIDWINYQSDYNEIYSKMEILMMEMRKETNNFIWRHHHDIYSEYFSHLQNFINVQFMRIPERGKIEIVDMFLQSIILPNFFVELTGEIKRIYHEHIDKMGVHVRQPEDYAKTFLDKVDMNEYKYFPSKVKLKDNCKIYLNKIDSKDAVFWLFDHITKEYHECEIYVTPEIFSILISTRRPLNHVIVPHDFNLTKSLKNLEITLDDYKYYLDLMKTNNNPNNKMRLV